MNNKKVILAIIIILILLLSITGVGYLNYKFQTKDKENDVIQNETEKNDSQNNHEENNDNQSNQEETDTSLKYVLCNNYSCNLENTNNMSDYQLYGTYNCQSKFCRVFETYKNIHKIIIQDDTYYIYDLNTFKYSKLNENNLLELGFQEENLNVPNLSNRILNFDDKNFDFILDSNEYILDDVYNLDIAPDGKILKLIKEDNSLYFSCDDNKEKINITNIKDIYIQTMECASERFIYILTNDGIVYYLRYELASSDTLKALANSFQKIESKYKYEKLYIWHMNVATCGYYFSILGEDANGNKYVLNHDMPFDNLKINYDDFVITKDNYYYWYNDFEFEPFADNENRKVSKIMSKNSESYEEFKDYFIFFENGKISIISSMVN